ncbi:MAG TPA: PKD domain-containing protein, partial [Chryseosolibacter sp.]
MKFNVILTLAVVFGLSFSTLKAQQTAKITSSGIGFLEYLPDGYKTNNNNYPIVIFLHGIGEKGTTSLDPATLLSSVLKVTNAGLPKYIKNGTKYPFLMIAPQLKSSYSLWPASYVMDVLNYVKNYLRIDESRIYITGLSLGGYGTWTTLAAYPDVFAASVPIASGGNALSKACVIASRNIPLWAFHGTADNVVSYTVTTKMIDAVNACTPKPNPLAKYTLFSGMGHNVWDKTYNETNALNWMLSFKKGTSTSTTTTNTAPTVSAGADKSITLPTSDVYIQGTASDADGSIASYKWTKISGGAASLGGATTAKLHAYSLVAGTYVFRLTVADDKGATKYDDMTVTVLSSTTNVAPVAYAGPDKTTASTSITISGSGTDKDGKIVSYKWIKYYG